MPRLFIVCALVLAAPVARAQDTVITIRPGAAPAVDVRHLPRAVADEVIRLFNAPGTVTFSGATRIPVARGVDGDVAIIGGPVVLAGRIGGTLLVINGDLTFERGAVIGGDVLVVGGTIVGAAEAQIAGEIRSYRDPLRYRREADTLAYAPETEIHWPLHREPTGDESRTRIVVGLGGTYNRVEGVPIVLGPMVDLRLDRNLRLQADGRLILRSAHDFSLNTGEVGYRLRGELLFGSRATNFGIGARAFDLVQSVEPWPLKDFEAGWAAALLRNDYRDWYRRAGAAGYIAMRPSRRTSLVLEGRQENHYSQVTQDPFSLFNTEQSWRENPGITDGRFRTAAVQVRYDSRNSRSSPSAGLFLSGDVEATRGDQIGAVCGAGPCITPADGTLDFQRLFVDARSYLRLSRVGRLNLRVAGGGKLGGDDLPLQYRSSLGYPDPLPGFTFRQYACGGENFPGHPALCDRVIVAQTEFRTHLGFDFGPAWANDWGDESDDRWEPFHVSGPDIVAFADAGTAWSVGTGPGQLPADKLPTLDNFRTDLGLGIDFGPLGFYLAKSVGPDQQPVSFFVRMGRRF
jgi:hypothetical protein